MKVITYSVRDWDIIRRAFVYDISLIAEAMKSHDVVEDDKYDSVYFKTIKSFSITANISDGLCIKDTANHIEVFSYSFNVAEVDDYQYMSDNQREMYLLGKLTKYIEKFVEIRVCDCGKQIENNKHDQCFECYVYTTDNPECCPICLENGSTLWVRYSGCECKSYYHKKCLEKVKKCPTCRVHMSRNVYEYL